MRESHINFPKLVTKSNKKYLKQICIPEKPITRLSRKNQEVVVSRAMQAFSSVNRKCKGGEEREEPVQIVTFRVTTIKLEGNPA